LYNTGELLTYNPAVSKIKGVVGKPGMKIPIIPRMSDKVPANMSKGFIIFLFF